MRGSFDEHLAVVSASIDVLEEPLASAIEATISCIERGGKVLAFGNGGSAAQAQHLAAELVGRFEVDRRPLPAIALGTDQASLTAIANDLGYAQVFARQVAALAGPDDLVVALSTSGTSPNVLAAVTIARDLGCRTVGLTGAGGADLGDLVDVHLAVPSTRVSRIQEVHTLCLHIWCEAVEAWAAGSGR